MRWRWPWRKVNEEYLVTYYFVSGERIDITYNKEKLIELYMTLRKSWNNAIIADQDGGINFAHVTHFKVKKIK